MRLSYLAALCTFAIGSSAAAQDTRDAELAHADASLNATYNLLLKQLEAHKRIQLRKSQRAWLAFRDLDCAFGWGDHRDCLIARTSQREEQLRTSPYWTAGGQPIRIPQPYR